MIFIFFVTYLKRLKKEAKKVIIRKTIILWIAIEKWESICPKRYYKKYDISCLLPYIILQCKEWKTWMFLWIKEEEKK